MNLLLDTCTALWFFEGSDRIPEKTIDVLRDMENELYMSDVSVLEIVIKNQLGKLPLPGRPSEIVPVLARKHFIKPLSLSTKAIFMLEQLPLLHRDPFYRLLLAQATEHGMTLVTSDKSIHQYSSVACMWD